MSALVRFVKEIPGVKSLRQARYARFFRNADNHNLFHGIYENFASAERAAPKNKVIGYDHEAPASLYEEFFENVGPSDFPALFWLERLNEEIATVYDFGGHVGFKYYAYRKLLGRALKWTTYDLPSVVARGRLIAEQRGEANLRFSDSVEDLGTGHDLLFVSGSFQYLENPVDLLLQGILRKPKFILVNMLPTHEEKSYITLQNIGPAFCPYKIFHKTSFIEQVEGYGYKKTAEWQNPEKRCQIPFHEQYSLEGYRGFLFQSL